MARIGKIVAVIALLAGTSRADPVPFSETADWFQLPSAAIEFSDPVLGGFSTARLNEGPQAGYIILQNDPFFGDPVLFEYNGEAGATIEFDWEFTERGNDTFYVDLIDPSMSDASNGTNGYIGPPYSLAADSSGSGHITWELSALGFTGPFGISFEYLSFDSPLLADDDPARTGFAIVSNLEFNLPSDPVPEPSTILLFAAAGLGLAWMRRRR